MKKSMKVYRISVIALCMFMQSAVSSLTEERSEKHRIIRTSILSITVPQRRCIIISDSDNMLPGDFWTPLHDAASKGDEEMVKHLLVDGASTELQDADGYIPLYWAAEKNHEAVVALLMLANTPSLDTIISFPPSCEGIVYSCYTIIEKSRELWKEHYRRLTRLLEDYGIPKVIAACIVEYHQCLDTQLLLFKLTKPFVEWRPLCVYPQSPKPFSRATHHLVQRE